MKIWYVKEESSYLSRLFNVIHIEVIEDKTICTIPICENIKLSDKKIIRIVKKLKKKLDSNNTKTIVLSEYLEKLEVLKDELYSNNINILSGRILFKYLIYDVIEYIIKKQDKKMEDLEVSILTNDNSDVNIENVVMLAKSVKSLNIITNNIHKFKKIEEYLYNELGIIIKISNNKKKAMLKTNIIINIDFSEELINKYIIPNNCIIINTKESINIKSKRFNGININNYQIEIPYEYALDGFNKINVCESIICKGNFDNIRKAIKESKIDITGLIGNNGIIEEQEYLTKV